MTERPTPEDIARVMLDVRLLDPPIAVMEAVRAERKYAYEHMDRLLQELLPARAKLRDYASKLLLQEMRAISEEYTCCGWYHGLEFKLWGIAFRQRENRLGGEAVNEEQIARLRELAHDCDGWWIWVRDHRPPEEWGETFVTREEMARRWEERAHGNRS